MQRVDHTVGVDVKVKRVIRVARIMGVAVLRLVPGDHLAHVLDQGFTFGDVLQREHALAMHPRAAGLEAAAGNRGGFCGHERKLC